MEEYPEPPGCTNAPSFVKVNPLNNESYLEKCCKVMPYWEDILRETHAELGQIIPGYNIGQIKEKFGGLRYYYDMPEWWYDMDDTDESIALHNDLACRASEIVRDAEYRSYEALKTYREKL